MDAVNLALKTGKSYQVFINKTNPNCDTHSLTEHQTIALMLATKNISIHLAVETILRNAGLMNAEPYTKGVVDALMENTACASSLYLAVKSAIEDNKITSYERNEIISFINQQRESLNHLEDAVNASIGKIRLAAEGGK